MLIARRNLMARLPYDAEVEYLEGDGLAFINTGIVYNTEKRYDISADCKGISGSGYYTYCMGWGAGGGVGFGIIDSSFYGWTDGVTKSNLGGDANSRTNISITINAGSKSSTVSRATPGVKNIRGSHNLLQSYAGDVGFPLFTIAIDAILEQPKRCIFWNCKISEDGELVRDMICVRVGTDGAMYDRVSGKLFRNAGTGNFGWKELDGTIVPPQ